MPYPTLLPMAALTFPDINPEIVTLGPIAIHWYGLGYVVGILFAWWYGRRLLDNPRLWPGGKAPFASRHLDDFIVWAALGIVGGGRLGYVLFYEPSRYLASPLEAFAIWQGGMSFHGGLLGMIVAMALFARMRGLSAWSLIDVVAAGVPVGLGLVRTANFINSELWGRVTDVPWAFVFPNGGALARHPSQLYEALLEGLVLFLLLRICTHRLGRLGTPRFVGGAFLAGYGASRILVEFFREPDAHIGYLAGGWLTMGMVLSLPMVVAGLWAMASARPARSPAAGQ